MAKWVTSPTDARVRNAARAEVRKQIDKIRAQVERDISANYHLLWLLALRDEYGFGQVRLLRALERVTKDAEAVSDGLLDFEDIRKALRDETGLIC